MQTASRIRLVTLGGTIRLTASRSDGCAVEITLTEESGRGFATRAVTRQDGRLVAVSARSWPLSGAEPELAATARDAIRIARNGLSAAAQG